MASPRFDMARFGAEAPRFSPRQADLLWVVGTISQRQAPALRRASTSRWPTRSGCSPSAPAPPAAGSTTTTRRSPGIDQIIPCDIYVPGCPPRPEGGDRRHPPPPGQDRAGRPHARRRQAAERPDDARAGARPTLEAKPQERVKSMSRRVTRPLCRRSFGDADAGDARAVRRRHGRDRSVPLAGGRALPPRRTRASPMDMFVDLCGVDYLAIGGGDPRASRSSATFARSSTRTACASRRGSARRTASGARSRLARPGVEGRRLVRARDVRHDGNPLPRPPGPAAHPHVPGVRPDTRCARTILPIGSSRWCLPRGHDGQAPALRPGRGDELRPTVVYDGGAESPPNPPQTVPGRTLPTPTRRGS